MTSNNLILFGFIAIISSVLNPIFGWAGVIAIVVGLGWALWEWSKTQWGG